MPFGRSRFGGRNHFGGHGHFGHRGFRPFAGFRYRNRNGTRSQSNSDDCGGCEACQVPWHYWVKHRSSCSVCIVCAIPTIFMMVDLILCSVSYPEKIGSLAKFTSYLDLAILGLIGIHFLSIFVKRLAIPGFYCHMFVGIFGFFGGLPYRLCIGIIVPASNHTDVFEKLDSHAEAFIAIGIVAGALSLISFIIWNCIVCNMAMADPDILDYIEKWSKKTSSNVISNLNLTQNTNIETINPLSFRSPVAIPQPVVLQLSAPGTQAMPVGTPIVAPAEEQFAPAIISAAPVQLTESPLRPMSTIDEIQTLEARLGQLHQKQNNK